MIDTFARIAFLRKIHLFYGLEEADLATVAAQLEEATHTEGSVIYEQNKKADSFFLIYKGTVRLISRQKGKEKNISTLVARDYFGYLDILERRARAGTATALTDTVLLYLSRDNFDKLRKSSANFRSNLEIAVRTRKLARSLQFKWLGLDETIYFLARKHPIILVRNLILPFLVMFVPAILLYWWVAAAPSLIVLFAASLSLLFNILWAIWLVLDWGNDYYIVTSKRVVWLEKVIAVYDSRQESPLNTVLAVAVETSLLGRWFDFGDVVVRTYVSKIIFRYVSHPKQAQRMIQEYWDRTKDVAVDLEKDAKIKAMRTRLNLPVAPAPAAADASTKKADHPPERGVARLSKFFGANRLRLRYEQGDTVVYRKHWFVLIKKAWIPLLGLLGIIGLFFYRLTLLITSPDALVSAENGTVNVDAWAGALFITFIVLLAWFLYDFVDWSNDRFEVTNEQIIDVYKKPLSTESRNASQLENILGTEFERVGILGQLFNYGTVFITVGSTKLTFEDVIDPATVQADINRRRLDQKNKKEENERAGKRQEMAEWLALYHENSEKFRQEEQEKKKPE